jgi:phage tail sheath protein FI
MGFQVSPGVNVSEVDLTTIVPAVSTTDGGFCGVFQWGPLNEIVLCGNENDVVRRFGRPDADTATSFFTAANFLAYGNKLRLVRVASSAILNTSFSAVDSAGTLVTGVDFLLGQNRVRPGDVVVFGPEERVVTEVISDTDLVISTPFSPDLSADNVVIKIFVGSLNATSEEGTGTETPGIGILIKNDDDYNQNHSNGLSNVGPFAAKYAGKLGNSIKVSMCPSANAFKQNLAGTVASAGTTLTGTGTLFLDNLTVGSIVRDLASGQERKVVSITSDTDAVLDTGFAPVLSGASLSAKWEFADIIGVAPGTSDYTGTRNGANDELHVVVIDDGGDITGTRGAILETHSFLSKAADAKSPQGASIYYVNALNEISNYVRWTDHLPAGLNFGNLANGTTFTAINKAYTVRLRGGRDVNSGSAIDAARIQGYDLFANGDLVDISLIMLGDATTPVAIHVINNICEVRKDCIAFVSPEQSDVVDNAENEVADTIEFRNTLPSSSYAVMDSGYKLQYDKYNDVKRWLPLNGDIAGLCVRTDTIADPWYSPAGLNRGNIKNVIRLAYSPFRAQRDDLYLAGINAVTNEQGQGSVLFGDKTLLSKPSAFDRINVRRLFIVLEKSISRAAKFTLFEFNDEFTRAQFKNLTEPFLRDVQGRRGIFDFRVVCDSTNNTPEVIDRNEFVGDIYIKPARSINFIQLNFVAVRTGVEFSEIVGKF